MVQFFQGESERAHLGIDNKLLVLMTESQTPRRQTRHVGLRHDFLFHRINNGNLVVEHIAGTVNAADFYTKPPCDGTGVKKGHHDGTVRSNKGHA